MSIEAAGERAEALNARTQSVALAAALGAPGADVQMTAVTQGPQAAANQAAWDRMAAIRDAHLARLRGGRG